MINNQVPSQEAIYSATYVETYLDSVENLPDEIQRQLSRLRELDVLYRGFIRDADTQTKHFFNNPNIDPDSPQNATKRTRVTKRVTKSLIAAQEIGDEKLKVTQCLQDVIDNKNRQLDIDYKNLDYSNSEPVPEAVKEPVANAVSPVAALPTPPQAPLANSNTNNTSASLSAGERASKRARRTRTEMLATDSSNNENVLTPEPSPVKPVVAASTSSTNSTQKKTHAGAGKKKKRKARTVQQTNQRDREDTPPPEDPDPIDPDEPTYCLCDQISFGEMILCDNDLCPIEWFHFSCVALSTKPKGKWFCPNCRGDRPNIMKPKGQFLKDLERYNKEKEERT